MTLQQLNLDWLLDQMKKIMQLLPFNGVAGDVLQRTVDGAAPPSSCGRKRRFRS